MSSPVYAPPNYHEKGNFFKAVFIETSTGFHVNGVTGYAHSGLLDHEACCDTFLSVAEQAPGFTS